MRRQHTSPPIKAKELDYEGTIAREGWAGISVEGGVRPLTSSRIGPGPSSHSQRRHACKFRKHGFRRTGGLIYGLTAGETEAVSDPIADGLNSSVQLQVQPGSDYRVWGGLSDCNKRTVIDACKGLRKHSGYEFTMRARSTLRLL